MNKPQIGDVILNRRTMEMGIVTGYDKIAVTIEKIDERGFWRRLVDFVFRGRRWKDKQFETTYNDCLLVGHAYEPKRK